MKRRRDEWRAKAEGYDAVRLALREKVGTPWPPHMSRLLWAGIAADEKKRADDAASEVARLRAALLSGMEDARNNALEEAARVAEMHFERLPNYAKHAENHLADKVEEGYGNAVTNIAAAIRALKDRNETEPEREPDNLTDNPDNRLDGEREET